MHSSKFKLSTGRLALALVVAMTLSFTGGLKAFAFDHGDVPENAKGSVTVHKYKTESPSGNPGSGSELSPSDLPADAQPLPGIVFHLYPLDEAKVEGGYADVPAATRAPDQAGVDAFLNTYQDMKGEVLHGTTGPQGKIMFAQLPLGYYLLVEDEQKDGSNFDPAIPSIITIPYAQQAENGKTNYLKDVHVYPKNVSNLPVEKNFQGSVPEYLSPGDKALYQITFTVPNTIATATGMKGTVEDLIPTNQNGEPMLTIGKWKAFALAPDSTKKEITSSMTFDATTNTWNITDDTAAEIVKIDNERTSENGYINKIQIQFEANVDNAAYSSATDSNSETFITNKSTIRLTDGSGKTFHDNEEADAPSVPVPGFGFIKVNSEGKPITTGASFKLATSYDKANAKQFLKYPTGKDETKDVEGTTNAQGMGSLSGLTSANLYDGDSVYTGVQSAITNAENKPGTPQSVDLWVAETKAPDGYRILQAPQKITLIITKVSESGPLTFKINGEPLKIVNYKDGESGGGNFALPNTGGLGGILLIAAGVLVFALGMTAHARNRRRARMNNAQE